jgi:hypothetical protein
MMEEIVCGDERQISSKMESTSRAHRIAVILRYERRGTRRCCNSIILLGSRVMILEASLHKACDHNI